MSVEEKQQEIEDEKKEKQETMIGISLTVGAALLALNDLIAGQIEGEGTYALNKTIDSYGRYNAKGIKEGVRDAQKSLIDLLIKETTIFTDTGSVATYSQKLAEKVVRYGKEKTEILQGSSVVGSGNRVQDIEGEMGKVIGSQQRVARVEAFEAIGGWFDMATLVFQITLVFGALSIMFKRPNSRQRFWVMMIIFGCIATGIMAYGSWQARRVW